jgi:O-antigen ligase
MLAACLTLGGGGTSNPATELVLECILPLLVIVAIWWPDPHGVASHTIGLPRPALAICVLVLLLPIIQLVPLPPAIWHALPGRQIEVAALSLVGGAGRWMPISLTPARTFASLLAIAADLGVFVAAARLDLNGRLGLCVVICGVALASVALGAMQMSFAGGYNWSIYAQANFGWLLGFHANRNATTDTLQIGVMALAALTAAWSQRDTVRGINLIALGLIMVGLVLGAVLTGSRTGILLLPVTYGFVVWILWPLVTRRMSSTSWWIFLIPPALCFAAAFSSQVQNALSRFGGVGERRWDIWHDTLIAIHSVWPIGGGISSFQVVYDATQSFERLRTELDARAHNDWLEWVLESGIAGIAVMLAIALILLACNLRALRTAAQRGIRPAYRAQVIFATGALLHIALHAVFDYPMRSMALAALVATCAAMLMPLRTATGASE